MRGTTTWWKVAVAAALPATFGMALVAGPSSAGAASATTATAGVSLTPATAAALPNTNIKTSKKTKKASFSPSKLAVTWSGPYVGTPTCTAALEKITITNKEKVSETVTSGGKSFGVIPAGDVAGVCFWGSGTHTFTYGLAGTKAKLKVSVS